MNYCEIPFNNELVPRKHSRSSCSLKEKKCCFCGVRCRYDCTRPRNYSKSIFPQEIDYPLALFTIPIDWFLTMKSIETKQLTNCLEKFSGTDDLSVKLGSLVDSDLIRKHLESENFVAIRIDSGSEAYMQFAQICRKIFREVSAGFDLLIEGFLLQINLCLFLRYSSLVRTGFLLM